MDTELRYGAEEELRDLPFAVAGQHQANDVQLLRLLAQHVTHAVCVHCSAGESSRRGTWLHGQRCLTLRLDDVHRGLQLRVVAEVLQEPVQPISQ
jgi:hypothetical protein